MCAVSGRILNRTVSVVGCRGSLHDNLHLGLSHPTLVVCPLARSQARHENTVSATAGGCSSGVRRRMEEAQHHAHYLGLHFAHTGEHVGVDGIGDGEFAIRLRLQLQQLILSVVNGTRNAAVLPACMVHGGEGLELGAHSIVGETLLGQGEVADLVLGHQLVRQLRDALLDLLLNLAAHAGRPQEVAVEDAADVGVELDDGADDAAALELPEAAARPSQDEQEEYNISKSARGRIAKCQLSKFPKNDGGP